MIQVEPIQAFTDWVMIVKPKRITEVAGLVIPDHARQATYYGLVISAGPKCEQAEKGMLVIYCKDGLRSMDLDSLTSNEEAKGEAIVCVNEGMIFCAVRPDFAEAFFGLRIDDIKSVTSQYEVTA
jgi:co-chaperonin GroES (HSP10)